MMQRATSCGNDTGQCGSRAIHGSEALTRLRRRARPAAALLFGPWLVGALLSFAWAGAEPLALLGLLPGLGVAVHLYRTLSSNLAANHGAASPEGLHTTLGAANWLTLSRGAAVVALAGFLPMLLYRSSPVASPIGWTAALLYLVISAADVGDGMIARTQNRVTVLGTRLDIETDAAGLMIASLVAVTSGRLPIIYLMAGCAYYLFVLAVRVRRTRALPVVELQPRPYARITAGLQMGLVAVTLMPLFNTVFNSIAAVLFMVPLLLGFGRDWLVVSGYLPTDPAQRAIVDRWASHLMRYRLAPCSRALLLFSWIGLLTFSDAANPADGWQVALGCFSLLASIGFLGRSASLGVVLLLAANQSPFGVTTFSLTLFVCAVFQVLVGTGAYSLWAPEERLLYRQVRSAPDAALSGG